MAPATTVKLAPSLPAGDPPLAPGTVIDGRYKVIAELGAGGMGRVYAAEHMFLKRPMALKLLRRGLATAPEATARLIQEATLVGQVPHPAVVRVFDCAVLADGQVYLAMELLRGESLEQRLRRPGDAAEVVPLLAELARGLAAVHRVGVVHRDIKPANVFLASSEAGVQAKLLDFGVAKLLPGAEMSAEASVRTQVGAVLGTPYYLAPEQARSGTIDGRADLYSLGVILYETLTGTLPFLGESFMAILAQHLHNMPLDPRQAAPERGIPDGVAQLTMRLLSKDPQLRARDGDALADELTALMIAEGAALRRVVIGGGSLSAGTGAATIGVATIGLAEGTGAATQQIDAGLSGGTGAATRRVHVGLAEGTGAATRPIDDGLSGGTGAATRPIDAGLSGGTGAATRPVRRGLGLAAVVVVIVAGIGWTAARTMRGETEAGSSGPAPTGEAVTQAASPAEGGPRAGPRSGAATPEAGVARVGNSAAKDGAGEIAGDGPAKDVGSAGAASGVQEVVGAPATRPRPGKKKPREGGTKRTPPPSTGGDPPLKPDVYDL
ncbi:MAG: protein kinase [Nannocystis sp.]|uniref:protein kinase domain-containing protein n=1 Tax=Nannocystis sp. TaxID=1962667 RepID=UPI002422F3D7|nr:protein kinase [Nannocystis sp.]MBK9755528.1 protein kinase [Nannocystis sp.]